MLKKSIFLLLALLVFGRALAPQVQAQDMAAIAREIEQVTNDFQAGKITLPEYQRRITELQQRAIGANQPNIERGQQELQQQQRQPTQQQQPIQQNQQQQSANAGWPPASAFQFQDYPKFSPPTQPTGITARYDASGYELVIYLTGGNNNTVLENLKQQIERITGQQMVKYGDEYNGNIKDTNYRNNLKMIRFRLQILNNAVGLTIYPVIDS
jgi:hypothetical protein